MTLSQLGVVQYTNLSQYAAVKVRIVRQKMYCNTYCLHILYYIISKLPTTNEMMILNGSYYIYCGTYCIVTPVSQFTYCIVAERIVPPLITIYSIDPPIQTCIHSKHTQLSQRPARALQCFTGRKQFLQQWHT